MPQKKTTSKANMAKSKTIKPATKSKPKPKLSGTNGQANGNKDDKNYWENLGKEFRQFMKARNNANYAYDEARFSRMYQDHPYVISNKERDSGRAHNKERHAIGQLAGALLQGRRYNTKTNKQVKKKK